MMGRCEAATVVEDMVRSFLKNAASRSSPIRDGNVVGGEDSLIRRRIEARIVLLRHAVKGNKWNRLR